MSVKWTAPFLKFLRDSMKQHSSVRCAKVFLVVQNLKSCESAFCTVILLGYLVGFDNVRCTCIKIC